MHLTLRQLQYFVATVDAGSMTRAAERLNVAPTALSVQLKAIEDGFGAMVLNRHSRGVVPTEVGVALLDIARNILRKVEAAERLLSARAETPPRILRLGLPPALTRLLGPDALTGLGVRMPGFGLQIVEGWSRDLERKLQSAEIDMAVGYVEPELAGLSIVPVAEDSLVFVEGARTGAATGPITLAEVLATDLVFYGEKGVGWKSVYARALAEGLPNGKERQVESIDIWRHLICRGGCTSVTSIGAVIDELERGDVVLRELAERPIVHSIGAAIREDQAGEPWALAMHAFIATLLDSKLSRTRNHIRRISVPA